MFFPPFPSFKCVFNVRLFPVFCHFLLAGLLGLCKQCIRVLKKIYEIWKISTASWTQDVFFLTVKSSLSIPSCTEEDSEYSAWILLAESKIMLVYMVEKNPGSFRYQPDWISIQTYEPNDPKHHQTGCGVMVIIALFSSYNIASSLPPRQKFFSFSLLILSIPFSNSALTLSNKKQLQLPVVHYGTCICKNCNIWLWCRDTFYALIISISNPKKTLWVEQELQHVMEK